MSHSPRMQQLGNSLKVSQLWQRLEALPKPAPENSILLRVLVQMLVIVGIVATDVAAETQLSWWAVPLSIVGASWSWYRRHDRNVPVKFLLAIGMLLALASYFQGLFGSLINATNDARIDLSQLLIQLQVLHSFDLPRRKDLGYSMVIGLILLGVAGTLSETLAFGPFLLVFLAIALPALVLDYRSRLGLGDRKPQRPNPQLKVQTVKKPFKFYTLLFLLIVGLGLGIFALLPRVPGYQLRTFPVSSPIEVEGEFDASQIFNSRSVREGREGVGSGQGTNRGPGEVDDTFYYGFNTEMNQNLRGEMKPQVVMRVRSQAPGFWRVLAFDEYTGQGWRISRNEQTQKLNRPSWTYQFFLNFLQTKNRTREVIQTYTVVSDMPNLLPALYQPRQLFFPTEDVAIDPEGSLRAPVALGEGLTYTVISQVPYRERTVLKTAPPPSPENTRNYREINQYYLQIPSEIQQKVRQKTEELLATSPEPITSGYEKTLYLAQALKQRYEILPDMPFLSEEEDLVEAFLFKYQGGYPDHFSTVLTMMLRSIGIPARLVAGYAPGEFNPFTGFYLVRNTDAYSMSEAYFPGYGWFTFDPIPGHELIPPSIEENQTFGVLRQFWNWVAGWLPSPVTSWLTMIFGGIMTGLAGLIGWMWSLFSQGWTGIFFGLILLIFLGFLAWLAWNQFQAWRHRRWLAKLPPAERLYQEMLSWLGTKGFRKHPAQTPFEYVQHSRPHHPPEVAHNLEVITQAYVSWRYGGQKPNLPELRQQLQSLKKKK
jgi:transglutaminase-like putative cysteine protease